MIGPAFHPATRALNHVLRSAPLAMERLARHAGKTAAFHVGPMTIAFTVQTTGEVAAAVPDAAHDLEVRIPALLVPRLAMRDPAAFDEIAMERESEFARDVDFLARNLTWDAEEDLAHVVGDVAAHRMAGTARSFARWSREALLRAGQGAAEYWTEEAPLIASRTDLGRFRSDVSELGDAVERLVARVERLG
ncbi:MAG TPA: ubiquinone biosynthesis protein [Usitatibacter sp.]|nr:ubiquinone biosynthesis protein [Usitatibacter sp.]